MRALPPTARSEVAEAMRILFFGLLVGIAVGLTYLVAVGVWRG